MERATIKISAINGIKKKGTDDLLGYNLMETVSTPYGDKEIKYALWFKKQDGSDTKAFTQFKSKGVQIGFKIEVAFNEEERDFEYTDKKTGEKKTGKTKNRTIMFFPDPEPTIPTQDDVIPPIDKYPF